MLSALTIKQLFPPPPHPLSAKMKSGCLQGQETAYATIRPYINEINSFSPTNSIPWKIHTHSRQIIFGATTLDWLVFLSLAKKILEIGPNGRKSSMRSDSLVSSDKFVTRIVAVSSEWKVQYIVFNTQLYLLSCTLENQVKSTFN